MDLSRFLPVCSVLHSIRYIVVLSEVSDLLTFETFLSPLIVISGMKVAEMNLMSITEAIKANFRLDVI